MDSALDASERATDADGSEAMQIDHRPTTGHTFDELLQHCQVTRLSSSNYTGVPLKVRKY